MSFTSNEYKEHYINIKMKEIKEWKDIENSISIEISPIILEIKLHNSLLLSSKRFSSENNYDNNTNKTLEMKEVSFR